MSNEPKSVQLSHAVSNGNFDTALSICNSLLADGIKTDLIIAIQGWSLYKKGDLKGRSLLEDAYERSPRDASILSMLLSMLKENGEFELMISTCWKALSYYNRNAAFWRTLAIAHYFVDELTSSIKAFETSLSIAPSANTKFNMSLALLSCGQYEKGFEYYEERFAIYKTVDWLESKKMPMPKWQGESLSGKSILVWGEQGLGDTLQFSRLTTKLSDLGATVDLILPPHQNGLKELMSTLPKAASIITLNNNNLTLTRHYDFHSPLMSLMKNLKLDDSNIPNNVPYLSVPASTKLDLPKNTDGKKLKVGLAWATALTDTQKKMDNTLKSIRNVPFELFEPLLALEGCAFYSLQLSLNESEKTICDQYQVIDTSPYISSFADTAAIMEEMDIIISIDTSVVHLAGALGKPTINLIPYRSCWRWQQNREDSAWYPTMRILRQVYRGDWRPTIKRLEGIMSSIQSSYTKTGAFSFIE